MWREQSKGERGAGEIRELGMWVAVEASQVTLSMKRELERPHANLPPAGARVPSRDDRQVRAGGAEISPGRTWGGASSNPPHPNPSRACWRPHLLSPAPCWASAGPRSRWVLALRPGLAQSLTPVWGESQPPQAVSCRGTGGPHFLWVIFQFTHHSSGLWKEVLRGFYFPTTANGVEKTLRLPGGKMFI